MKRGIDSRWLVLASIVVAALPSAFSCDPVHNEAVAAIGSDPSGEPNGPRHRAGQPCVTCHGGDGPGKSNFLVAGTVYQDDKADARAVGVVVRLTDSNGDVMDVAPSNDVGNFYLSTGEWSPVFPIAVTFMKGGGVAAPVMTSHMGRQGSCADCHFGTTDAVNSLAQLYMKKSKPR